MSEDDTTNCCETFSSLDGLVVDHIASFLNVHSIYSWVCAHRGALNQVLSPEWFFYQTLPSRDKFEILPLDSDARELFYLAEAFPQMRKCRFIPKFCVKKKSMGIQSLAEWLDVDPNSVYVESIAMLMGRLFGLVRDASECREIGGERPFNVFLCDVLCAARIFGFSDVPDHDQMFRFDTPLGDARRPFLTIEECCSLVDSEDETSFDVASISVIQRQMQRFVKMLMTSPDHDSEYIDELTMEDLYDESWELPVNDTFDMDIDTWFIDQLVQTDDVDDAQMEQARNHFMLEGNKTMDYLKTLHSDLPGYDLIDFGICERRSQLPPWRRLSQDGLKKHLKDLEEFEYIKRVCSNSALRFIQELIEGIHFGSAVEVKVRKRGLVDVTWDYGVLFSANGTSWKCLVISEDDDQIDDDDDDDDYNLSDDDDHVAY